MFVNLVQAKCLPLPFLWTRPSRRARMEWQNLGVLSSPAAKLLQSSSKESRWCCRSRASERTLYKFTRAANSLLLLRRCDLGRCSLSEAEKEKTARSDRQEAMLRDKPDVLVYTQLVSWRTFAVVRWILNLVETLVVDEADLVLSFGYSNDIAENRQVDTQNLSWFLMSATLSPSWILSRRLFFTLRRFWLGARKGPEQAKDRLKQFSFLSSKGTRISSLYVFLKLGLLRKGLFFVNSTDAGYRLKLFLEQLVFELPSCRGTSISNSSQPVLISSTCWSFDYLIATDASTVHWLHPGPRR
jgi:ATP-dependent RNA helicase DDX56/DBP9